MILHANCAAAVVQNLLAQYQPQPVALLLMLLGCVREWLALGTVFGTPVGQRAVLPMAGMPAGGFIVLGVLCAVWRALAARRKAYLVREARSLVDVHAQKEADGEQ